MGALLPIGRYAIKAAEPALGRGGPHFGTLLTEWPSIMGERIAAMAVPVRIRFPRKAVRQDAVLDLSVPDNAARLVLSYELGPLRDRLNTFFGWHAVKTVKLLAGVGWPTYGRSDPPPPAPSITPEQADTLCAQTHVIEDGDLRQALQGYARAMAGEPT